MTDYSGCTAVLCSHRWAGRARPPDDVFADAFSEFLASVLSVVVSFCLRQKLPELWRRLGGRVDSLVPDVRGAGGLGGPHQALRPLDQAVGPVAPHLRTDGDGGERHRLHLHPAPILSVRDTNPSVAKQHQRPTGTDVLRHELYSNSPRSNKRLAPCCWGQCCHSKPALHWGCGILTLKFRILTFISQFRPYFPSGFRLWSE